MLSCGPQPRDWDTIPRFCHLLYLVASAQGLQSDISVNPFIPGSYMQQLWKMSDPQ